MADMKRFLAILILASMAAGIASLGLIGYIFNLHSLFHWMEASPSIALQTCIGILCNSVAIILMALREHLKGNKHEKG